MQESKLWFESINRTSINVTLTFIALSRSTTLLWIEDPRSVILQTETTEVQYASDLSNTIHSTASDTKWTILLIFTIILAIGFPVICIVVLVYRKWRSRRLPYETRIVPELQMSLMGEDTGNQTDLAMNFSCLPRSSPITSLVLKKYIPALRKLTYEKVKKKNQDLNREFRITNEGIFYVDLCMEQDITQDGQKVKIDDQSFNLKTFATKQIFEPLRDKEQPCRVLLLGGAGMGKTTVSHELTRYLADPLSETDHMKAVFYFECARFTSDIANNTKISLEDLLFVRHEPSNLAERTKWIVLQYLLSHQPNMIMIIDGLDELSMWETCSDKSPEIIDVYAKADIHEIFYNLIKKNLMPMARLLVTSRTKGTIHKDDFDKIIRTRGFSKESTKKCLKAACQGNTDVHVQILQYIEEYGLLQYCDVPLACVLLQAILHEWLLFRSSKNVFDSVTCLYERLITEYIIRRPFPDNQLSQQKRHDLNSHQQSALLSLAALAARGTTGKEFIDSFNDQDLEEIRMKHDDYSFGLLEVANEELNCKTSDFVTPHKCFFINETVQSFLAALHLCVKWGKQDVDNLCRSVHPRIHLVLQFMAGLLGDPRGIQFIQAVSPDRPEHNLNECAKYLLSTMIEQIQETEMDRRMYTLFILTCIREGKMAEFFPDIEGRICESWEGFDTLKLCNIPGGLLLHQLNSIGYWLKASKTGKGLCLVNNSIGSQGVSALVGTSDGIVGLRAIDLGENKIGDTGLEELQPLMQANRDLELIRLQNCDIGDAGAAIIIAALKKHTHIRELRLENNIALTHEGKSNLMQKFKNILIV